MAKTEKDDVTPYDPPASGDVSLDEARAAVDPIAAEWANDYEPGSELFCATFDADDFDPEFAVKDYEDGTTLAVRRCPSKPTPGWIRRHAHLGDLERTFALIEQYASDRALDILDSLTSEKWDEFVEAWGRDSGLVEGKSRRSSRRRGR